MDSSLSRWATRGALAVAIMAAPTVAQAQYSFYGSGGSVWVKYMGCDAGYTSDLSAQYSIGGSSFDSGNLFRCHYTAVGTEYNLGPVDVGTEVIFRLFVENTGYSFYSGPGSRNPDGLVHVNSYAISGDGVYTREFGFEDLYGGGDMDFNDNTFRIGGATVTATPEPATMTLMATGMVGLFGAAKRRRKAKAESA